MDRHTIGDEAKAEIHYLAEELWNLMASDGVITSFFVDHCIDGAWYWDLENPEHEWMSPSFWTTLGYDPATKPHLASAWQDIINGDDLTLAVENLNKHLADPDQAYDQEVRYRHANGSTVWIRCRGIAFRDHSGKPLRMLGVHTDITRLKEKEAELTEALHRVEAQEAELELLINSVPAKIFYKDDQNIILRANKAAADSLNTTVDALKGADTYELFPEVAAKYHTDDLEVINSNEPKLGIIETYVPENGDRGWLQTDKIPATLPDGSKRLLAIATDITEFKLTQEKLDARNRSLKDFASIAAHDLQAPLRQASMFADMFQLQLKKADIALPDGAAQSLELMLSSMTHMREMVKALNDMSRLEASDIQREDTDLNAVVAKAIELCDLHLADGEGEVRIQGEMPVVRANSALMVQVFQNLISNACKYAKSKPLFIDISASFSPHNLCHVISVRDNGVGIPEDRAEAIFEPFERLANSAGTEGSGIGLALCRRIAETLDGTLSINTSYTAGACFVLSLPAVGEK